ncbi:hypothetical protein [Marinicella gelatinilytica]|uniref:hypothetical protein n=1 Tax=Marinicella gelatinilytica TaxID=2996017 RepID=UPI002260D3FA|nr:hypothetical protein [Marinicella gelatinilytica]MCX7545315.1 hypothetical protein [Marinicella gelatinilytica]
MRQFKLITILLFMFLNGISNSQTDCESGHWIKSKSKDGSIIILEDKSVWQVESVDTIDSKLWLRLDEIIVCDYKLINVDNDTTVEAKQIKSRRYY